MKDKIEGIVLSEVPYGENSHLIQTLCKEYGYLSFIVKSSQKMNAKNRVFPFSHCLFLCDYYEGKTIFTLQSRELIKNYFQQDLRRMAYLNVLGEMIYRLKVENFQEVFEDFLCVLNNKFHEEDYKYACFLVARLLCYQGIQPYMNGCVMCNHHLVQGFSIEKGGLVCSNHLQENDFLPLETLRKLRHIFLVEREKIPLLAEKITQKDFMLLMDYLQEHSDIRFKSYTFFCDCFSL